MNLKPAFTAACAAAFFLPAFADAPQGYYSKCEGLSGQALLSALHTIISDHNDVGYNGLYDLYKRSDIRPEDNSIWDMYSTKHWSPSETCGNYSGIGSCYNREHSFPKSWFGGKVAPMYSDAYHLYPTDGQVNGYRGNYPFGECAGGQTWSNGSVKALGRLGASTFPGYTGTVFEPDNEYKGDFARSYFYMAACYNDRIASWDSPMLAGNAYPAFSSWAADMLLKWHRQDVVSRKELTRNEVVADAQRNRNPFIDHPEFVEYIWGDRKNEPWHDGNVSPAIESPAKGVTVDMGLTSVGRTLTTAVRLKTAAMAGAVSVTVSGAGFSVAPASVAAAQANSGTDIVVTYTPATAGKAAGSLTVKGDGGAEVTVSVVAEAFNGIPLYEAEDVTDHSFTVRWVDVDGGNARYKVDVRRDGTSIAGYPVEVASSSLTREVDGLEAESTYTFSVAGPTAVSASRTVTTAPLTPMIRFLYDSTLDFATLAGVPSDVAELMVEIDNIAEDVELTVDEPFQLSTDRNSWSTTVTLRPEEDRFYMRLLSDEAGHFSTAVEARAGSYFSDEVTAEGDVRMSFFCETFDAAPEMSSYNGGTYVGSAATWTVGAGNIWDSDNGFNGGPSMRFRKDGLLEMTEDKAGGAGKISFDLRKWDNKNDGEATVVAEYSTDGGRVWIPAGTATTSDPVFSTHEFEVKVTGSVRIRLRQTAGNRFNLDNVAITDYSGTNASNSLDYHLWDAYSLGGAIVIESAERPTRISVYAIDGTTRFDGIVSGSLTIDALPGLYIVVSETDDFSRRVLVK